MAILLLIVQAILILNKGGKGGISDIFLFLLPLVSLIYLYFTKKVGKNLKTTKAILLLIFGLVIFQGLSVIFSVSIIESSFEYFRQLSLLSILLLFLICQDPKEIKLVKSSLLLLPTITSLLLIFRFLPVFEFAGHNNASEYLILYLPLAYHNYLNKQTKLSLLTLIVLLFGIYSSSSRTTITLAGIYLVFAITMVKRVVIPKKTSYILLTLVFLSLTSFMQITKQWYFTDRLDYFRFAVKSFMTKPLFGFGPNTFSYRNANFFYQDKFTSLSHNFVLDSLFENGVIYTILFIALFLTIFKRSWSDNTSKKQFISSLELGILLSFINSFVDAGWRYPATKYSVYLFLGLIIFSLKFNRLKVNRFIFLIIASVTLIPSIFLIFTITTPLLNRTYYENQINNSIEKKDTLLFSRYYNDWQFLDRGAAERLQFFSRQYLIRQDFHQAADLYFEAAEAPFFNQSPSLDYLNLLLSSTQENDDLCKLLTFLDKSSTPGTIYDTQIISPETINNSLDKLTNDPNQALSCQKDINRWQVARYLFDDPSQYLQYQKYAIAYLDTHPQSDIYYQIAQAINYLSNREDSNIRLMIDKSASSQSIMMRKVVSRLYWYLAFSGNDSQKIEFLKYAVTFDPYFATNYIQLAYLYDHVSDPNNRDVIIDQCTKKIGISCRELYDQFLSKQ